MSGDKIAQFAGQKYLSLESYRQNGQAVRTPVWFAEGDGRFYIYTLADSYKVKRIRRNPHVRIAPCDVLGNIKGQWIDATALFLDQTGDRRTHELLNRKYGLIKSLFDIFRIRKYQRLSIAIQFD